MAIIITLARILEGHSLQQSTYSLLPIFETVNSEKLKEITVRLPKNDRRNQRTLIVYDQSLIYLVKYKIYNSFNFLVFDRQGKENNLYQELY